MRILITGGAGTVGTAFISAYYDQHKFASYSRGEHAQYELRNRFPDVVTYLGGIEDECRLRSVYDRFKPDAVIHAAALKHIDLAEQNPAQTARVNVLGSLNVAAASIYHNIPITIGVSTDKACGPSVYGVSKYLMERCFLESNSPKTRFAVVRFGNVAGSNGSVIPKWQAAAKAGKRLEITDPSMHRLFISKADAAALIQTAVNRCEQGDGGFVLLKEIKQVNILELAKRISPSHVITGRRDGERQHESLLRPEEVARAATLGCGYIRVGDDEAPIGMRFMGGYSSADAPAMTPEEIDSLLV